MTERKNEMKHIKDQFVEKVNEAEKNIFKYLDDDNFTNNVKEKVEACPIKIPGYSDEEKQESLYSLCAARLMDKIADDDEEFKDLFSEYVFALGFYSLAKKYAPKLENIDESNHKDSVNKVKVIKIDTNDEDMIKRLEEALGINIIDDEEREE